MTPTGFTTVAPARGEGRLRRLDEEIARLVPSPQLAPTQLSVDDALSLLDLAFENTVFDENDEGEGYKAAMRTSLRWLTRTSGGNDSVFVVVSRDRQVSRLRGARISNSPTTQQQHAFAAQVAQHEPVLYLMRQNGDVERGWKGLPFWWPVVQIPSAATPALYVVN